jgi:hypothetical protein
VPLQQLGAKQDAANSQQDGEAMADQWRRHGGYLVDGFEAV